MTIEDTFNDLIGLVIEGIGSDTNDQLFIELSDGSEIEIMINEDGFLEVNYYKGFLDA
jgi:hypothetical protein